MPNETVLKAYGFVCRGKTREKVFKELVNPTLPSQIAKKTNIRLGSVSRALLNFEKEGLVRCVNPEEKRGRVYQLTDLGKQVFELLLSR